MLVNSANLCLPLLMVATLVAGESVKVGDLVTYHHDVSGEVFAVDESHIRIKDFNYDGAGPDAFFWIGWDGTPSSNDETKTVILAYPYKGKNHLYRDETAPVLGPAENEDVILTLPEEIKASQIKWLSVWCRKFAVNFGDLIFPEDAIQFPAGDSDSLPPPRVPPSSTTTTEAAQEDTHHHHHDDHADAEPEAEPEYEHEYDGEPEPESESEPEPESNEIDHDKPYNKHPKQSPRGSGAQGLVSFQMSVSVLSAVVAALMLVLH